MPFSYLAVIPVDSLCFRNLLKDYNTQDSIWFGHRFQYLGVSISKILLLGGYQIVLALMPFLMQFNLVFDALVLQGYFAGGAGYVLSQGALER